MLFKYSVDLIVDKRVKKFLDFTSLVLGNLITGCF